MSTTKSPLTKARKPLITRPKTRMRNNNNNSNNNAANCRSRSQYRAKSSCSATTAQQQQQMSKAELESVREKLFNGSELADFSSDELNQVFPHLREFAFQKGSEENYDDAQKAFKLSEAILAELKMRNPAQSREEEIEQTFSSRHVSFEDEWAKKFDKYDEETEQRRKELDETHEEQRTSFERLWNEDMPRRYRKPSQRLLQVKKIEKSLALSCEFERAKQIHQEAEKIAEQELQAAQANLNRDYEIALQKLLQKQRQEVQSFEDTRAHLRNLWKSKYEEEKTAYNNRTLVVATRQMEAEKGYRTSKKTTEPIGTSGTFTGQADRGISDVLLPPLRPPNDPEFLEEDKKKKRELQKKKLAFQKQNAQVTLAKFTVDGQEYVGSDDDDGMSQKQTEKQQPEPEPEPGLEPSTENADEKQENDDASQEGQNAEQAPESESNNQNEENQEGEKADEPEAGGTQRNDENANEEGGKIGVDLIQNVADKVDTIVSESVN